MKKINDSINNQKYITITGETRNNIDVYVSFRKMQNKELARFLNKNYNGNYKLSGEYIYYDTSAKEADGNSYITPTKNKKQRNNWLNAMGWEDLGCRFGIVRLDEWNIENIKKFISKTGLKNIVIKN